MRSFNWQAECIELANMKAEGQASKDLAEVFGLHKTAIDRKISMGEALRRVNECRPALIGENQFLNHIMPLRIPPDVTYKGKKGFQTVDYSKFEYSEIEQCVDLLNSGKLTLEELPADR